MGRFNCIINFVNLFVLYRYLTFTFIHYKMSRDVIKTNLVYIFLEIHFSDFYGLINLRKLFVVKTKRMWIGYIPRNPVPKK